VAREKNDAAHWPDRNESRRVCIFSACTDLTSGTSRWKLIVLSVLQCKTTQTENNNCEPASHTNYSVLITLDVLRNSDFQKQKATVGEGWSGAEAGVEWGVREVAVVVVWKSKIKWVTGKNSVKSPFFGWDIFVWRVCGWEVGGGVVWDSQKSKKCPWDINFDRPWGVFAFTTPQIPVLVAMLRTEGHNYRTS